GVARGERSLLFAFEESREQLFRNATGWGVDFEKMERDGRLRVVCSYPESASLEDHLIHLKAVIEEFKPDRVAVDSLSALERVATVKLFREFVIALSRTSSTASWPGGSRRRRPTCWAAPRRPRRTSRRSPTRSSCCATW